MRTPLNNARHEQFARLVAGGKKQIEAFMEVFPHSRRWKRSSIDEKASKLAAKVRPRITEINLQAVDATILTVLERKHILSEAAREALAMPLNDRDPALIAVGLKAVSELNRMEGCYSPDKRSVDITSSGKSLSDLVAEAEKVCEEMTRRANSRQYGGSRFVTE